MNYAIFEKQDHDIYYVKFSPEVPSGQEFEIYLQKMTDILYRNKSVYFIMDASYAPYISSDLRKQQAKWIKKHKAQIAKNVLSTVYIIPNAIQRSILNAIYILQKPASPYKIVSTYKYAFDHLLELKAKKNVA